MNAWLIYHHTLRKNCNNNITDPQQLLIFITRSFASITPGTMFLRAVPILSRSTGRMGFQKRFAGGFLKKNLFVEENAGIRENSYKTWYASLIRRWNDVLCSFLLCVYWLLALFVGNLTVITWETFSWCLSYLAHCTTTLPFPKW